MRIQHQLTAEADRAAARYDLFANALRGVYLAAVIDRNLGSAKVVANVRRQGEGAMDAYIGNETRLAHDSLEDIVSEARGRVEDALSVESSDELSEAISEHFYATHDYLTREISLQAARDVSTLVEETRRAGLHVDMAKRVGADPAEAYIGSLDFKFRDRRNFRVQSRVFVRATWRAALLSAFNETTLLTLADHGQFYAEIDHLDSKAPVHGKMIAIQPDDERPSYGEIKDEVFHPNSDAVVVPLPPPGV